MADIFFLLNVSCFNFVGPNRGGHNDRSAHPRQQDWNQGARGRGRGFQELQGKFMHWLAWNFFYRRLEEYVPVTMNLG